MSCQRNERKDYIACIPMSYEILFTFYAFFTLQILCVNKIKLHKWERE